jgi:hypothetical protein
LTLSEWLEHAKADARRRNLPELAPLLEGLAQATEALRAAEWLDEADGRTPGDEGAAE